MTVALGGARSVPTPDPIARDFLLLALRLDQHIAGLVDGYYGPADLKAQVDQERLRHPTRLAEDAENLRERLPAEAGPPDRRRYLDAQLVALSSLALSLTDRALPYLEHVQRCFDYVPLRTPESVFAAAAGELARALPGSGPLPDRIAAWDDLLTVPAEILPDVVGWLVGHCRRRASALFGLPEGEDLQVGYVTGQPWSGYNWYHGGLRSRVDVNLDLPSRVGDLVRLVPHETYPGHHLEHAWKEQALVVDAGRLESSVLLINAPECLISEGLADLGVRFAVPPGEEADLVAELLDRAGVPAGASSAERRRLAEIQVRVGRVRADVGGVSGNAALLRHAEGAPRADVLAYLERWSLAPADRAAKRLEFIEHPLWRTYVFVYHDGLELLGRWLDRAPEAERPGRFRRLLREQITPGSIRTELGEE